MNWYLGTLILGFHFDSKCTRIRFKRQGQFYGEMFSVWLLQIFVCVAFGSESSDPDKRLLLNDPDAILTRLAKMESKIANLEAELAAEKGKTVNQGKCKRLKIWKFEKIDLSCSTRKHSNTKLGKIEIQN